LAQPQYVENRPSPGSFLIATDSTLATLFVDTNDFPGVIRAVHDLRTDIARVTGLEPHLNPDQSSIGTNPIIVGTLGKSPIIDEFVLAKLTSVKSPANGNRF